MSPFQIVLLAVFGAFAVAGVLIFAFLVGSNTGSTIGAVTIWGTFDETAVQTVIRQLSENDTRLRGVAYAQKNPETFETELTNALASGTGPDLVVLRDDYSVIDAPKLASIPYETFSRDQFMSLFIDGALPFLAQDGVLAIPLSADPMILFWNRDLLAASGFAKPPVYWDEVFDMARTITDCQQVNASKHTVVGCDETRSIKKATIGFGEYQNVDHAKEAISLLMLQAGSSMTRRDASSGQLSPSLLERSLDVSQPAESAISFYTTFANPAKDSYSWNRALPSSRTAFASGDLALYVGFASEDALIRRLNPNLRYGLSPVPQVRNLERSTNTGHVYGFAIPRASKNPQGALTIAYLLASPEGSKALSLSLGLSSARRDVLAEQVTGNEDLINRQTLIMRTWEDPDPVQTNTIFRDMIESITSGSAKITEALQRAEQSMRQITAQ